MKQKKLNNLKDLENQIGYHFKNPSLLDLALTHSSYKNEMKAQFPQKTNLDDNERLEFLGDTILSFILSKRLFTKFKNSPEGTLSKYRSILVSKDHLFKIAKTLKLAHYLKLGKGESAGKIYTKANMLANTVEAVIAAIYLDGGIQPAENFISKCLGKYLDVRKLSRLDKNFKSALQEYSQKRLKILPYYHTIERKNMFYSTVSISKSKKATGWGPSKREAEQEAAKNLIKKLKKK